MSILPILFLKETGFIVFVSLGKFWIALAFDVSYNYTSEVYDSKNRVNGIGMGSMVSRISGIVLPFFCNLFSNISIWGPYGFFCGISLLAAFTHIFLPYDTKGRKLDDKVGDEDQIEKD